LNPDEAVCNGLGWLGAIRSTKYKIPYEIGITDLVMNLSAPLCLHVVNEKGESIIAKPLEMYKNGDKFPMSKKVTLRFPAGKYTALLKEGELVHEALQFEIKPRNFEQFTDVEFAKQQGVDFNDTTLACKVKVIADNDGYFRLTSLNKTEHELVFDDVKKKVPNPDLESLVAKREEEIKKREEEFAAKTKEYEEKKKVHDDLVAKDKEEKKEEKREAPEVPVKALNPPEVPKEIEITEKVPRVALMS